MREYTIGVQDDGRKLEKWLMSTAPGLTKGLIKKFSREKRVKVNLKAPSGDIELHKGDNIRLFIADEYFVKDTENKLLTRFTPHIEVVYEDNNILIVNKRPGLRAHPDDTEKVDTLITHVQAYLYQKGEMSDGFEPALCNRIDRFTGGLVIAAKNREALVEMDKRIRAREVKKFYLCAVYGMIKPKNGALKSYIINETKKVRIVHSAQSGAKQAETRYKTLAFDGGVSLMECELVTGRTHQIRAQFADIGHPLIGDTQYGEKSLNLNFSSSFQQLFAYRLEFDMKNPEGVLGYLNGKSFRAESFHSGFDELQRLISL